MGAQILKQVDMILTLIKLLQPSKFKIVFKKVFFFFFLGGGGGGGGVGAGKHGPSLSTYGSASALLPAIYTFTKKMYLQFKELTSYPNNHR
jgi:hypothetical protein